MPDDLTALDEERSAESEALTRDLESLERQIAACGKEPLGIRVELRTKLRRLVAQHAEIAHMRRPTRTALEAVLADVRSIRNSIATAVAAHAELLGSTLVEAHRVRILTSLREAVATGIPIEDALVLAIDPKQVDIPDAVRRMATGEWGALFVFAYHRRDFPTEAQRMSSEVAKAAAERAPDGHARLVVMTFGRALVSTLEAVAIMSKGGSA